MLDWTYITERIRNDILEIISFCHLEKVRANAAYEFFLFFTIIDWFIWRTCWIDRVFIFDIW